MNKTNKFMIFILLIIAIIPFTNAFSGLGTGTTPDPFLITNCSQLQETEDNLTAVYKLNNTIDCTGFEYAPVDSFSGELDGNSQNINNLQIIGSNFVGIFGNTHSGYTHNFQVISPNITGSSVVTTIVAVNGNAGVVANITVTGATIEVQGDTAGGLVGKNAGYIYNSHFTGTFTGDGSAYAIGGLAFQLTNVADMPSLIKNSSANITLTFEANDGESIGGLVAELVSGNIEDSHAISVINGNGTAMGGLVGILVSSLNNPLVNILNSYAITTINGGSNVGGLVGEMTDADNANPLIRNSYAQVLITSDGNQIGGLVGLSSGDIEESYATGTINGFTSIGGLVARQETAGMINNSYSTVNIHTAENHSVGGLVGEHDGLIQNSYSVGLVNASGDSAGGLVGVDSGSGVTIESFWNTQTSGKATSAQGTGKTTTQMKQQLTFNAWDFTNIWSIEEGVSYPILQFQEQEDEEEEEEEEENEITGYVAQYEAEDIPAIAVDGGLSFLVFFVTCAGVIALFVFSLLVLKYIYPKNKRK